MLLADASTKRFDKERDALRELAFAADTREEVDEVAREIEAHGGKILDSERIPVLARILLGVLH